MSPFKKQKKYQDQKEARFYIPTTNNNTPLIVEIGSIEDIACMLEPAVELTENEEDEIARQLNKLV